MTERHQPTLFPIPPPPVLSHNQQVALAIGELWDDSIQTSAPWTSIPRPDSLLPPPFILRITHSPRRKGNRRLYSCGNQATMRHGLFKQYPDRFRPNTGGNTTCPCSPHPPIPLYSATYSPPMPALPIPQTSTLRHQGQPLSHVRDRRRYGFTRFVDETGILLCPLPPRRDPR
jgi:hypothetical protein